MTLTCWEKISLVALAAIGLRILIKASVLVWRKLMAPSFGFGVNLITQGRWAVVTGGTSGIGKAYAEQLARKGLDIVLISRSLTKLEEVAAEIKQRYSVKVRVVEADLTEGQTVYTKIAKATEELEIAVVVNNAGSSYDYPELFTKVSEDCVEKIVQLNVAAVTGVARVLLPKMFERRKGVLINISSSMAVMPSPYLSVYAASKAYVLKLSSDLATEAEPNGVTVQCVIPGPVATKMSKIKKATWMAPTAEKFVESSLKTIGIESCTTGYPPHCLLTGFVHGLRCVCEKGAVWLISKTMCNIRARALNRKTNVKDNAKDSLVTE
ncbi:PREDICTED: very-long-chain 3-oxoacyl-CoA reductase-B-like [Dufourea novaeangliae]|uniref:Estradiol 17-beta-dehydrogenase 12-B n=1 Tax=Dufourea novaeangliae TaxID=178035 RepID=A0A154NW24_DUFNO|nr:PREDICTED: very-long-chain 3-oxoacyl-CoA reductase-B-like [Dufourea novaeangliae]XP_015439090.1 PREDICTED: very-long-chain 3-oxoacyl-CoA reductase-B-like [Dufourea novaeangliae]XP_015439098.1 PREDICTED: very-long-chain 3-oxoacyl-CoA reductase-B-like [Dufourea novaeangliae]KZC03847.1 Estradiol 17-beta-dehydrogenase 12-B [Dufourea novaeangliae]